MADKTASLSGRGVEQMHRRLLVVSPHPDDETLGAGGTILRYKQQGDLVFWLNFTDKKEEYGYAPEEVLRRKEEIERVKGEYKVDGFYNLQLEPAGLHRCDRKELIEKTDAWINETRADTVILPFNKDVHSDHRVVFETVYSCTKIFRYPAVKRILMMEVLSETDYAASDAGFVPNYFIDISEFLEDKIKIMKIYQGETKAHPFPRSEEHIRALAVCRGAAAGCRYAEGFVLLKGIE